MSGRRTASALAAIPIAVLFVASFTASTPLAAPSSASTGTHQTGKAPNAPSDTTIILRGEAPPPEEGSISVMDADSAEAAAHADSVAAPAHPDTLASPAVAAVHDSLVSTHAVDSLAVADSLAAHEMADSIAAVALADSLAAFHAGPAPFFAVVAYDSSSASWGVACATPEIASGGRLMGARAGAGAVASLGPGPAPLGSAFGALMAGASADSAQDALRRALEDPAARQNLIVARNGGVSAISGARLPGYSGVLQKGSFACAGYALHGQETLEAMAAAFHGSHADLASRLVLALDAGDRMENRPFQHRKGDASAAVLVVRAGADPKAGTDRLADLRVDLDPDPIAALRRLTERHVETFLAAAHVRFGDEARKAGDSQKAKREYAAAEAGFRTAVEHAPDDPDALNELAWFLATRGSDPTEALHYAERAVSARGDDPNLLDTLAEAAYHAGDLEKAVDAAQRAADIGHGNARYAERLKFFEAARLARAPATR